MDQNLRKHFNIFSLFLFVSIILTFPIILNMSTAYYGERGDAVGVVWWLWWADKALFELNLNPFYCSFLAHPYGVNFSYLPVNIVTHYILPSLLPYFNHFFLYNSLILMSFVLSGYFMFLFVSEVLGDDLTAFLSGFAYMMAPYHFVRTLGHPMLANVQWVPLYFLFLYKGYMSRKWQYYIASGIVYALLAATNYYYGFMIACVTAGVFGIELFLISKELSKGIIHFFRKICLTGIQYSLIFVTGIILILPFLIPVLKGLSATENIDAELGGVHRPIDDLNEYSLRPLSHLIPPYYHPFLGVVARNLIGSFLYGTSRTEHAVFLGFVAIFFLIRFIRIYKKDYEKDVQNKKTQIYLFTIIFTALIFSLPALIQIGKIQLYFPSYITYQYFPMFRNPIRFGIITLFGVLAVAAIGISYFLKDKKGKKIWFVLLLAIIYFDFMFVPGSYFVKLNNINPVYQWLKEQDGDFAICEYPMIDRAGTHGDYYFAQVMHGKRLINGARFDAASMNLKRRLLKLHDPDVVDKLKALGTRFILVHREAMSESETVEITGVLPDYSKNPSLKKVRSHGDIDVYEIVSGKE